MINQSDHNETKNDELDEIRNNGLKENNALRVYTYLKANERARSRRLPRWIWELLQNAHDASIGHDDPLIVKIEYNSEELVFLHNGSSFKAKQIFNLIYHGSTKGDQEETIGEYGSGFLTTHLLSPEIKVSGQLDNKRWFDFHLTRKSDSPNELLNLMDDAWDGFKETLSTQNQELSMPPSFTTRFTYPIVGLEAKKAVDEGIKTLEQCAPLVVVFNPAFSRIDINNQDKMLGFEAIKRRSIDASGIQEITVASRQNGNSNENKFLLASGEMKTSVAVPLVSNNNCSVCQSVENMPRLFKAFPLVGTESFSFPAIVNSFKFTVTEARDDVYLGQDEKDEANIKNQAIIEESCALVARLLQYASSKRWHHVHRWAEVPPIQHNDEKTREWLRKCIKENFINQTQQILVVLNVDDNLIAPKDAWLPMAEDDEGIKELWSLLNDLQEYRDKLPRLNEVTGWCKTIKSWAEVNNSKVSDLPDVGVIDGSELADQIENKCSGLEDLQNLLQENICAIDWLNRFYRFLRKDKKINNVIQINRLVLNQANEFNLLKYLHRDQDIGEELKDIAELLGCQRIRHQLRDPRLTSLDTEQGADDWDSTSIFDKLHTRIQEQAKPNPSPNFKVASVKLFAWIVSQKDYSRLSNFPVFAADGKSVLSLPSSIQDGIPPLAPIRTWSAELQQFSDLFPPERILDDAFFEKVPEQDEWQRISEDGSITTNIVPTSQKNVNFKDFYPEEALPDGENKKTNHITEDHVFVTDIAERTGILDRVTNSRSRALIFWRFLTEWLIKEDNQGLEVKKAMCQCGTPHEYYPAEWLMPVRNNRWIRHGDLHPLVEASSLTKMLRDNEWNLDSLKENPETIKLLEVIGITEFDFLRAFVAKNDEERNAQDKIFREILTETRGDLNQIGYLRQILETSGGDVSEVTKIAQDLKDDASLKQDLEKLQKRRHTIKENQSLGNQVEEIVGKILKDKGYSVKGIHKGADFQISEPTEDSEDTDNLITLNVIDGNSDQDWLIEVKSARTENVKMSFAQANTAVEYGENFLLCVVPIKPENTKVNLEEKKTIIKKNMQFIKNIGTRIAPLLVHRNKLEDLRTNVTTDNGSGIRLVCDAGTTGIRVNHSVWEDEGFLLDKLAENLK